METQLLLTQGSLRIFCRQTTPQGSPRRVVLGVHGLGGSTQDQIQTSIAEEMDLFGSATLRFDFPSHGQSPMGEESFTLENCMTSLKTVAAYAKKAFAEVEDLCIFASGFGAYVTMLSLPELVKLPGRLRLVVQTPAVKFHETMLVMAGISAPTLEAMGRKRFERLARPFSLDYQFYLDAQKETALNPHPIPMLILHGEADSYIKMEDIRQLRILNDQSKLVIIPGTSHRFLEEGAWDMVLDLTRDWFEFEQVLCCDWE